MHNLLKMLALALVILIPVTHLSYLIYTDAQPTNQVRVGGYDPRDLLRGRYVTLRYLWQDELSTQPNIKTLPDTGRFFVDERYATQLDNILRTTQTLEDDSGLVFVAEYRIIAGQVTPVSLSINGTDYKSLMVCVRSHHDKQKLSDEEAVKLCLTDSKPE